MAKKKTPTDLAAGKRSRSQPTGAVSSANKVSRAQAHGVQQHEQQQHVLRYGAIARDSSKDVPAATNLPLSSSGSTSPSVGVLVDQLLTSLTPLCEVRRIASGKRPRFSHEIAHAIRTAIDHNPDANPLFLSLRIPGGDHRQNAKRKAARKSSAGTPHVIKPRQRSRLMEARSQQLQQQAKAGRTPNSKSSPALSLLALDAATDAASAQGGPVRQSLTSSLNRRCCYGVTRCTAFLKHVRSTKPGAELSTDDARMLTLLCDDLQRLRHHFLTPLLRSVRPNTSHRTTLEEGGLLHCARHFPRIGMLVRVSQLVYPRRRRGQVDSSGDLRVDLGPCRRKIIHDAAVIVLETALRIVVVPVPMVTTTQQRTTSSDNHRASEDAGLTEGCSAPKNPSAGSNDSGSTTSVSNRAGSLSIPKHFPGTSGQLSALLQLCAAQRKPSVRHQQTTTATASPHVTKKNGVLYAECLESGPLQHHVL